MINFLSMKKQIKEQEEYGDYVFNCILKHKEAVPFEEYRRNGAM